MQAEVDAAKAAVNLAGKGLHASIAEPAGERRQSCGWSALRGLKKQADEGQKTQVAGLQEESLDFADMVEMISRQRKYVREVVEMSITIVFVLTFILITTFVNKLPIAHDTVLFAKFLILQDAPDETTYDDKSNFDLPELHLSMWNQQLYDTHWKTTDNRRKLRGVGDDEDEGSFFETWMQQEEQVWTYLSEQLGDALLGEVPLERCRTGLCGTTDELPRYMLQVHRLLGSAKFELRRIESGTVESGVIEVQENTGVDGIPRLDSYACSVPAIYSRNSILRINGERSPIIIDKCYPDERAILARWNESAFGNPPFYPAAEGKGYEYYIPLNITKEEWINEILSLRKRGFLDQHARILTVYFNSYNVNSDLLLCVRLRIKFSHYGGLTQTANARTLSLNRHLDPILTSRYAERRDSTAEDILLLMVEVLYVLLLIAVIYFQARSILQSGIFYFLDIWNVITLGALALAVFVIFRRVALQWQMQDLLSRNHPNKYVDLYRVAEDANEIQAALSVNMLMMLASMFKFFHVSPKLGVLTGTLERASSQLLWFLVLFFVLFMSYVMSFYMAFGSSVEAFATITNSAYSLMTVLLGVIEFDSLFDENAFMACFLYWSYVILVYIVILSCFVAIIMEAFGKAKIVASKQHDPLADLVVAILNDNYRVVMGGVKMVLSFLWGLLTNTHNVQITNSRRLNIRVLKTQQVLEMVHETRRNVAIPHLMQHGKVTGLFGHEKLRSLAWKELRAREMATQDLLRRIKEVKQRQVDLLQEASEFQKKQLNQLEEISTELWKAWQMSLELRS